MQQYILGIPVTFWSKERVQEKLVQVIHSTRKPYFVVTANPEFILQAQSDPKFRQALLHADLILPDGMALVQAKYFLSCQPRSSAQKLQLALSILAKSMRREFAHETVTGISLTRDFLASKDVSVFLLGGRDGVAHKLGETYKRPYWEGPTSITRASKQQEQVIFEKVREAHPDVLLVSFGHFTQEKWIAEHLSDLSCKIVIGVGSSFDELAGYGYWHHKMPHMWEQLGLKWLWRLLHDPKHFSRVWKAVVVFPITIAFGKREN